MQQGAASWRRINEVLQTGDQLESTGQQLVPMIQQLNSLSTVSNIRIRNDLSYKTLI